MNAIVLLRNGCSGVRSPEGPNRTFLQCVERWFAGARHLHRFDIAGRDSRDSNAKA